MYVIANRDVRQNTRTLRDRESLSRITDMGTTILCQTILGEAALGFDGYVVTSFDLEFVVTSFLLRLLKFFVMNKGLLRPENCALKKPPRPAVRGRRRRRVFVEYLGTYQILSFDPIMQAPL